MIVIKTIKYWSIQTTDVKPSFYTKERLPRYIQENRPIWGTKILQEIAQKWENNLVTNVDNEEVKYSISMFRKTTRNMYLWDIQYKLWHERVATNTRLFKMDILEYEDCEYCQQPKTNVHDFVLRERAKQFWREIKNFLQRLGYQN